MGRDIRTRREWAEAFWRRRTRVGKITLVLFAVICVCTLLMLFGVLPTTDVVLITLAGMAMTPLLLVLLFRWFTYRVLWRVRNRLILTYLLMGLAPLVMFVMLMGIASYLMAGQYATNVGLSRLTEGVTRVRDAAGSAAIFGGRTWAVKAGEGTPGATIKGTSGQLTGTGGTAALDGAAEDASPLSLMELRGNVWVPQDGVSAKDSQ